MEVKFQFTPTKEDYISSIRAVNNFGAWTIVFVIAVAILTSAYYGGKEFARFDPSTRADWYSPFMFLWFMPVFTAFVFFALPVATRINVSLRLRSNEAAGYPITWHMTEAQIITMTKIRELKVDWSVYSRAIEYGPYYLLLIGVDSSGGRERCGFIPKRAFESPQQESEFRALVEKKLGNIENETFKRRTLPLRLQWAGLALLVVFVLTYSVVSYLEMYR